MARSTKLERLITDPLNTRISAAEAKVTTIETRNLVDEGDNVSVLVNDAGYQNATQVDTKIQAVVGAAPAALDTLKEIADKLADEDSTIAALVAQDTANATALSQIQTVNTTQATTISQLQTKSHDAVTINPLTKALVLTGQELKLKVDPSIKNVLTEVEEGLLVDSDAVRNALKPTLTVVSSSIEIFIDNVNGSDTSTTPTVSATPFKTLGQAFSYVKEKYYFTNAANNFITFTLLTDYTFGFAEPSFFDGSEIIGSTSLLLKSNNSTPKIITTSTRQPIVFQNFSYELNLQQLNFVVNSDLRLRYIPRVVVIGVSFSKLIVRNCELFNDSTTGSTFNGAATFSQVDDVRFLATSEIKNAITINKANTVFFGGQIDLGSFDIQQVTTCQIRSNTSVSEATLTLVSTEGIFKVRDSNEVVLNGNLNLNSTSGVNQRRFFVLTNINNIRSNGLSLVNMYSAAISSQSESIFKIIHGEVTTFTMSAGTGFKPTFVAQDSTKKLINLEYSTYALQLAGSTETALATNIFSTTDRLVTFDFWSSFFGENLLDLRGKIRRLTLTADITLTVSDASRQHLINQTASDRNIGLPSSPGDSQEFEVINNSTSTHNLIVAGETVVPGSRHAVQWDGTEWVVM